jgi:ferric-dicitrate binding protein FerR (iron transport regulator)
VQTAAEGALVHRADGSEMTLARNTRLSLGSVHEVRLWSGRVHVKTYGADHPSDLVVITDRGSIEHLGTQFLVDCEAGSLLVAVRDGRVAMHYAPDLALELRAGQAARVDPQGELERWSLAAFDDIWDWADALATPMAIDGQSLYSVLNRIAERSGLTLRFSTPQAESQARALALHGAPLQLQPRYALSAVLATTTLSGTADGREILVSALGT